MPDQRSSDLLGAKAKHTWRMQRLSQVGHSVGVGPVARSTCSSLLCDVARYRFPVNDRLLPVNQQNYPAVAPAALEFLRAPDTANSIWRRCHTAAGAEGKGRENPE